MEAWSLTRTRLTKFLRDAVIKRFNYDPLVQVVEISKGEFRVKIMHMDGRVKPRFFRVKVIDEAT